jgi:hypothetical protein
VVVDVVPTVVSTKELVACEKLYVKVAAIIFFKYIVFFLRFNIIYDF